MDTSTTLRNAIFAICACLFAVIGLAGMMVYGSDTSRFLAVVIALLGCFSQFAAQDSSRCARYASLVAAYLAFVLVIVALFYFR